MKRVWMVLTATLVLAAAVPSVASAASSPSVVSRTATSITTTSAVLQGTVTPNGASTLFSFSYGATTALGVNTAPHRAGRGVKPVAVTATVTGLTPGTVYYYRVNALSSFGGVNGAIKSFKTAGPPPPGAVTGPAVNVLKTQATPTGSVTTNGAPTTWVVQYGLTTGYGLQTSPGTPLAPGAVPTPVSATLPGLSPATLFHYRIVAYHDGVFAGAGADATFFTEPVTAPTPNMTTRTTPASVARGPFQFTTAGTLHGATFIPAAQRCAGNVGIRYYNGKRQLAYAVAPVTTTCTFSASVSFTRTHGKGAVPITITIDYRGTGYLGKASKTDHVTAGR